jgi:dipeptidase E
MPVVLASESSRTLTAIAESLGAPTFARRFACISTAAAVYPERPWIALEQDHLRRLGATVREVELSTMDPSAAQEAIGGADGVFVHGGNTFFLLQELQRTGLPELLATFVGSGGLYIGSSAGSIVAGPRIDIVAPTDDPSKAPTVNPSGGLGLVGFVPFVHYDDPAYRAPLTAAFELAIAAGVNVLPLRNDQWVEADSTGVRLHSLG